MLLTVSQMSLNLELKSVEYALQVTKCQTHQNENRIILVDSQNICKASACKFLEKLECKLSINAPVRLHFRLWPNSINTYTRVLLSSYLKVSYKTCAGISIQLVKF